MKSKLVFIVLFYFILNFQFNAQSNNNSIELIKPYKIEINDDDSLKLLKTQINGSIRKIELAKDEIYNQDSARYYAYEEKMYKKILLLIEKKEIYESKQ